MTTSNLHRSACAVFIGATSALLLAQAPPQLIQPSAFSDIYRKIVPAGGGIIRGVVEDQPQPFAGDLQVSLPTPPPAARVCLEFNSIDGRYYANAEYPTSRWNGVRTLAPRFADKITPLPASDVAVAAMLADRCDRPSTKFAVSSWAAKPADHPSIVILVDAQPDMQVSILTPGEKACEPIKDSRARTATARCRVPSLQNPITSLTVRLTRFENTTDYPFDVYAR